MTHVLAIGGGGFSDDPRLRVTALDRYLLSLSGVDHPTVCFIPTASGDAERYIRNFETAFGSVDCTPIVCHLFSQSDIPLAEQLDDVDVFYVGGGNTANLMALWRLHGLDNVLDAIRERSQAVFGGISAGGMCWFNCGVTDSFGPTRKPLHGTLGWIPGSFLPHANADPSLRATFRSLIADRSVGSGYAVDDGAALHFIDGSLDAVVAETPGAGASYLEAADGTVIEKRLDVVQLGR